LRPEILFGRRLDEAQRGYKALVKTLEALIEAIGANGLIRVPQFVYRDAETATLALERPESKAPVPSLAVEFVLGRDDDAERRVVDCTYKMVPGIELHRQRRSTESKPVGAPHDETGSSG
jgi:hypothetical protein